MRVAVSSTYTPITSDVKCNLERISQSVFTLQNNLTCFGEQCSPTMLGVKVFCFILLTQRLEQHFIRYTEHRM